MKLGNHTVKEMADDVRRQAYLQAETVKASVLYGNMVDALTVADVGFGIIESQLAEVGHPIYMPPDYDVIDAGAKTDDFTVTFQIGTLDYGYCPRGIFVVHPIDSIWWQFPNDPFLADHYVQKWIKRRIDAMANDALMKLYFDHKVTEMYATTVNLTF